MKMLQPCADFFRSASFCLLLAAMVFTPWAYGGTRDWTIVGMDWILGACFLAWILSAVLYFRAVRLAAIPSVCLILLVSQAAWMAWNAHGSFDWTFRCFVNLAASDPGLPGAADREAAWKLLPRIAGLAGAFFVAFSAASDPVWRRRLALCIALTGVSIVLLGLAQKATGAPSIFWSNEKLGKTFFAGYRYHGNAGAFLNLVWPFAALFLLLAFRDPKAHLRRAFWSLAFLLSLSACVVNLSRASTTLAGLGLLAAAVWMFPHLRQLGKAKRLESIILAAVLLLFVAGTFTFGLASGQNQKRWALFNRDIEDLHGRTSTYLAASRMVPDAGPLGFGPGSFGTAFYDYARKYNPSDRRYWKFTHSDWLQYPIEWGWLGAALWVVVIFGAVGTGMMRLRGNGGTWRTHDVLILKAALLAMVITLVHALVDFPLQIASIQLYFIVMAALCWNCRNWPATRRQNIADPSDQLP
jgi:hypothetical protein